MKAVSLIASLSAIVLNTLLIIGWFGITPETLGQSAYDILRIAYPFVVAALGFAAGWNAKKFFDSRKGARFYDPIVIEGNDKVSIRSEEGMRQIRRSVMQLEPEMKALMKVVVEKGEAFSEADEWRCNYIVKDDFFTQFLDVEYIDRGVAKIMPTALLIEFKEKNEELFASVNETVESHRRTNTPGVTHISGHSFGITPFWWWYE